MTRRDLALMFGSLLNGIDRARRVGDEARVFDLRWHIAAMGAHVWELLLLVIDDCAAMAATECL